MFIDAMDELVNKLTDAEREEWSKLDGKINSKQLELLLFRLEKLGFIQKICRGKGLIAENLKDLKSENGELFKEVSWHLKYRHALASNGLAVEEAYCCYNNFKQRNGCGWVKGRPIKVRQDYNTKEGIFGIILRCRICDKILEEIVL